MRQIVLDTETTGLEVSQGHRIIEVGCVELVNRKLTGRHFHEYINPQREVDLGAYEVHGLSDEFLADKPIFSKIAQPFVDYIQGAELIIHNASFDVGFLEAELGMLDGLPAKLSDLCVITDSLALAREKHPGQRNSLDALCKRYEVDNFNRDLHGALLDSEILAEVYLRMTGGQTSLGLSSADYQNNEKNTAQQGAFSVDFSSRKGRVIHPDLEEEKAHTELLERLDETSQENCLWKKLNA